MEKILTGAMLVSVGGVAALGATPNLILYLGWDSEPVAGISQASLPDSALPNLDPGRDSAPGLVLAKSSAGAGETDPTKYQQREVDAGSATLAFSKLEIWAAMKDFNTEKTGLFGIYLLDCAISCTVLESGTRSLNGKNDWRHVTVPLSTTHTFDPGHSLAVKVVVLSGSDDDMWFAYGTATFDAHLVVRDVSEPTTTAPSATTSVLPVSTTSTAVAGPAPTTTSTTTSSTTSTTLGAAGVADTPTTTTPVSEPSRSGVSAGEASAAPGADVIVKFAERPQVIANSSGSEIIATEMPVAATLTPQQGLMVAFATMAQTLQAQLLAALGLTLFGSLLILAIQKRQDDDGETSSSEPGSWWFSG